MQTFKKFILQEFIFTILISFIALTVFNTILQQFDFTIFWSIMILIAVLTAIFHYSILQVQEKAASKFSVRFMMVSGIKMMIYLVIITSYVFVNPEKATPFLISFLILYLLYTIFEVILIIRVIKSKN